MPLIENVLKTLAKIVLIKLGLTASPSSPSTTYAAAYKKMFWSGTFPLELALRTTLIISNEEINYIMKIIKPPEKSGLLIKSVSKTIKNEAKQKTKRRVFKYVIRYIKC